MTLSETCGKKKKYMKKVISHKYYDWFTFDNEILTQFEILKNQEYTSNKM